MVRRKFIQSQIAMKTIAAILLAIALSGCGIPVAIRVPGQHGTYGYSSKSGLSIELQRAFK